MTELQDYSSSQQTKHAKYTVLRRVATGAVLISSLVVIAIYYGVINP